MANTVRDLLVAEIDRLQSVVDSGVASRTYFETQLNEHDARVEEAEARLAELQTALEALPE